MTSLNPNVRICNYHPATVHMKIINIHVKSKINMKALVVVNVDMTSIKAALLAYHPVNRQVQEGHHLHCTSILPEVMCLRFCPNVAVEE